ncbi:MAG: class I SAM-dependent methyltransferase [Phycisphaerales bacterium]|nr:class I SAM-dependent methyltransferase [Phycisphaerales bacterium]
MSALTRRYNEQHQIKQMISALHLMPEATILDVGCGYGRNLRLLREIGLQATGVDVNEDAVAANRADGFDCISIREFEKSSTQYDFMVFSHIIEHFTPSNLLAFMDNYLSRLKTGGHLLIATPLMSPRFYDDFDHVRPYPPYAIDMMFTRERGQTQYASRHKLEGVDIRVRRRPIRLSPSRLHYLQQHHNLLYKLIVNALPGAYKWSCGLLGWTDGWMGIYRNLGLRNDAANDSA